LILIEKSSLELKDIKYRNRSLVIIKSQNKHKQQTMKKATTIAVILSFSAITLLEAQLPTSSGVYTMKNSLPFESPKGHKVMEPIGYGKDGIIQVNAKGVESFSFQKFSSDLKFEKENTVSTEGKIREDNYYERFISTKNKTYLFTREVKKEAKTEGIAAIEFQPQNLDFVGKSTSLFQSTDKVKTTRKAGVAISFWSIGGTVNYDFVLSEDKTKFMYDYTLVPKEKKDKINKDIIGLYAFDENLNKLWGGEYKMPYTEAIMDNLGYTLSDDGKIYLLAKVFENDERKAKTKDGKPNYHFEVLVYSKDSKVAKPIEIKLDNYFPQDAYIYEDATHNIVIAGFYSKSVNGSDDGAYMVKLDVEKGSVSKLNGGYYEIPSDVIKSFTSAREKKKMDKKESKGDDLGIYFLRLRNVYTTASGSIKFIAEQYEERITYVYTSKGVQTKYDTYAEDIFVISVDNKGKMEWVRKIPKSQHSGDWVGASLSINNLLTDNDLHIFFLDNLKNWNLPETQAPKIHQDRKGGFLSAVTIDSKGTVTKNNLGDTKKFKTNFFIRYFVKGNNKNVISTERKKKKNILFSIEVK